MKIENNKFKQRKYFFYLLGLALLFIWGVLATYIAYNKSIDLEIALYKNNELTTQIESIKLEVKNWLQDTYKTKEMYKDLNKGLGSFSDFDPNNNAVKEIRVQLLADRGIDRSGVETSFFTSDKNGKVVKVYGDAQLPNGFESADIVILRGHLTQSGFHVHEILLD